MSTDELVKIANADTPAGVTVPNTLYGLFVWASGKWGFGVIFCISTFFVYQDQKDLNRQLLDAYRDNTRVIAEFAKSIDAQTRAIEAAHQRAISGK